MLFEDGDFRFLRANCCTDFAEFCAELRELGLFRRVFFNLDKEPDYFHVPMLRNWILGRGQFFVGRVGHKMSGACWLTHYSPDDDSGSCRFHFCTFPLMNGDAIRLGRLVVKCLLGCGLDNRFGWQYTRLLTFTPYENVSRFGRHIGFVETGKVENFFGELPAYTGYCDMNTLKGE